MAELSERIAHVFPSRSWGGAEIYAVQLAEAQQSRGQRVVLWVPAGSRLEQEGLRLQIPVLTEPVPWRYSPFHLPRLAAVIQRCGIHVLHCHWSGGLWAFWGVGFFVSIKRIYHIHLWMKHSKKDPLHWLLYRSVDLILVAGQRAQERVFRLLPVRRSSVQILPYAIPEAPSIPAISERNQGRLELGLRENVVVIGIFARHDRQKGQMEFLSAFQKLLEKFPEAPIQLLMIGDPTHGEPDSESYHAQILEKMKYTLFQNRVVSLGSQKDFQKYLALCDVLAVPSYHESYSLMILHAFSLGIPVMASASGGTPDLVNESNGWLFEPENVDSLFGVLEKISLPDIQKRKSGLMQLVQTHHTFFSVTQRLNQQMQAKKILN